MREGFSTASAEARALGFGAGMGLPNIERNSDRLRVTSTVGEGTRVSFSVHAAPGGRRPGRATVVAGRSSPTSAATAATASSRAPRPPCACARHGRRCWTTSASTAPAASPPATPRRADAAGRARASSRRPASVLAVPPALLAGFGDHAVGTVLDELRALGFAEVVSIAPLRGRAAPRRPRPRPRPARPAGACDLAGLPGGREPHRAQVPVARASPGAARFPLGGAAA